MDTAPDLFGRGALSLVLDFVPSQQRVGAVRVLFFGGCARLFIRALFYEKEGGLLDFGEWLALYRLRGYFPRFTAEFTIRTTSDGDGVFFRYAARLFRLPHLENGKQIPLFLLSFHNLLTISYNL